MLISVIIPVYNVDQYLDKCIASVVNQTYKNIEILLVDDGSTDNSGILCDKWKSLDARIHVYHQNNRGVSAARNFGMSKASGDYITFIDSDDWIDEDYFSLVAPLLRAKPSILVNHYIIDYSDGTQLNKFSDTDSVITYNKDSFIKELLIGRQFHWGPVSTFYKTALCKKCKFPEDIVYGEDLLFKYQYAKKCDRGFIYQPLGKYHYFCRANSAVNSYPLEKRIDDIKVFNYILQDVSQDLEVHILNNHLLPRLIQYSIIAENNNLSEIKKQLHYELIKKIKRLAFNSEIKFILKLKIALLLLPYKLIKPIIYCWRRL